jgi:hypothetical protein
MYSCLAGQSVPAQESGYSDDEVKAQFVEAGMFCHAEFIRRGYRRAFEMAGCDTNRYARILRELAVENTNETEWAIASLGQYKTTESLPFLYSYATNAVYGAKALKSVFAIEGVNSNSVAATCGYLAVTNAFTQQMDYDRSDVCEWLLKEVSTSPSLAYLKPSCLNAAVDYAQNISIMHKSLDGAICAADPTYRHSKRRLAVMRSAQNRCWNPMLTNYVTNAINELVAYPEANLPD